MKAVINNNHLSRELKKMSGVIRKNSIIPITSSVLFSFDKNVLKLTGTDLETTYITLLDCDCGKPFSFPIEYSDIVNICSSVYAPIEIEVKDRNILIKSGKSKYNLTAAGNSEDFPAIPNEQFENDIAVDYDFFYNLANANMCRSKAENDIQLNMAAIDVTKKSITTVGATHHMIYKCELPAKSKKEFVVMVSDTFVQVCKTFQVGSLSFSEKFIKVEHGNDIIISRLSEQRYPNYSAIIPKGVEYGISINKDEFKSALRAVTIGTIEPTKICILNFSEGKIKIASQDILLGKDAETEIDISHSIKIPTIKLNLIQLTMLVGLIDSENIDISITNERTSVLMKPSDNDSLLILLQPSVNVNI